MRFPVWRIGVFLAVLAWPLFWLYQAWSLVLGPDPGKVLVDRLGLGTLILLLVTLCLTPLQRMTGWAGWFFVRRQLGLWTFTYVTLHLCAYLVFVLGLDWGQLGVELQKRPYIIVGSLAFLLLAALAVTSNRYSQRRLGRRWKTLHKSMYLVVILGLVHFLWIVRADLEEWSIYAACAGFLLILRLPAVARHLPRVAGRKTVSAKNS